MAIDNEAQSTLVKDIASYADAAFDETTSLGRSAAKFNEVGQESVQQAKLLAEKNAETIKALGIIAEIAEETNLLSLNASIEAARAGEQGRGFAVVAEEIRKLADDSENMAQEIRQVMDVLLSEAEQAVAAAEQVRQGNIEQQEALGETLSSVNGMLADIEETVEGVKSIADGASTCVASNDVVSDAMSSLSAISQQNAASSETTGASVQELSATVSNLADSATGLRDVAEQLNNEMSFFK